MSKKKRKNDPSSNTPTDVEITTTVAAETADSTSESKAHAELTEPTLSKKERKAAEKAEKAAQKSAKAEKSKKASKSAKAEKSKKSEKSGSSEETSSNDHSAQAPAMPKFKHLRKKKLTSGKGATPREVGESLVALFNAGKADEAEKTWYHRKIESIEGDGSVFDGLKGVAEKSAWWCSENKIVAAKAEGPFVCSTGFTVIFTMTVERTDGTRMEFREAGVYTVEKGRIVREQFMY
ncbi:MAG: hypothetical protein RIR10_997 [Planctomycetota bacterium]|jgi:hypothetical protein